MAHSCSGGKKDEASGRQEVKAAETLFGLWFVFGGFFALFEPEFQQPGLAFRLGNVFQCEGTVQAIFIERPLFGVGFLKGFGLQSLPIRIGDASLGPQEVDLDGLEGKDFREHLDDRGIRQESGILFRHNSTLQSWRGTQAWTDAVSAPCGRS